MNDRLAFWDGPCGPVPCRVTGIEASPDPDWTDPFGYDYCVIAVITADRGPYRRGERLAQSPAHVWPRDVTRPKRGSYGQIFIVGKYDWKKRTMTPRNRGAAAVAAENRRTET